MMRFPGVARQCRRAFAVEAAASPSTSSPPAVNFSVVKFQKEDVEQVMTELPSYNFYEIREPVPNPYKDSTLDRSVLLDPPQPVLAAPKTEFSKLENGVKVVSIDKQGLTSRLGLFVDAGSRFEQASNFGVSHMAALMGFTSSAHLSHLRTVKTLEQLGANNTSFSNASREEISYKVDVMREFVPLVLPLMVGNVLFPRLLPWEVKAAHKKVKESQAQMENNPDAMLNSLLHKAAYCNNTLGLSTHASERAIPHFTPETIRSYMLDHFAPERMVIVGVNVAHSELTKWAMRSFAEYNAIPMKPREKQPAQYTGGDLRQDGPSPFCHVALALKSVPFVQEEIAPVTLLQTILGGASAAATGVGFGATSRLSTQVLQQSPYVESISAFNTSYSDSGLFGVYGVSKPEHAGKMVHSVAKSLTGLTSVSQDELAKAKSMLKGRLFRQVDNDAELLQDLGSQLLLSGRYGSASDFAKIIDHVTAEEVTAAAKKMLAGRPTVAAFGDTHAVPHYSEVEAALKV